VLAIPNLCFPAVWFCVSILIFDYGRLCRLGLISSVEDFKSCPITKSIVDRTIVYPTNIRNVYPCSFIANWWSIPDMSNIFRACLQWTSHAVPYFSELFKHLGALIEALTEHTAHIDTEFEEELWSAVLVLRGRIYEIKRERNDLHLLWLNCQQLAEHSGQTAYLTGQFNAPPLSLILVFN